MLRKIFKSKFHLRFVFNPLIRYLADKMGMYQGVNVLKREVPIIVSLTSYEERFSDLVISLYSLLNQKIKPDRIILWLSDEFEGVNDLPYEITRFIKNGLEIRFVKDIKSYTKAIYAFKEFPDAIIVTADDDVYYPSRWLEKLYHSYIVHPEDIQVHRAHRVLMCDGVIAPYEKWNKHIKEESARYDNFLTGVGGVLYPPKCFTSEVLREDIFLKEAPFADDIWLWVMAILHNRKIRVVKGHIKTITCTNILRQLSGKGRTLYAKNSKGENDRQLGNLMKYYKRNILSALCLYYNNSKEQTGDES